MILRRSKASILYRRRMMRRRSITAVVGAWRGIMSGAGGAAFGRLILVLLWR